MCENLKHWSAIILAGGENSPETRQETGEQWEAMVSFANQPSIEYVLEACRECDIGNISIVLTEQERHRLKISEPREMWATPGKSLLESLQAGVKKLNHNSPTLVLPSDTPLLRKDHIIQFVDAIQNRVNVLEDIFFAAGVCPKLHIQTRFPNSQYKFIRLREGKFASGAFFAGSKIGIESAMQKVQHVINNRKNFFKWMIRIGLKYSLFYLTGRITTRKAENIATELLNGKCLLITNVHPDTTFDFDSIEEYKYLQQNFKRLRLE